MAVASDVFLINLFTNQFITNLIYGASESLGRPKNQLRRKVAIRRPGGRKLADVFCLQQWGCVGRGRTTEQIILLTLARGGNAVFVRLCQSGQVPNQT
jgi:predicted AAA+ superfamily ATPase